MDEERFNMSLRKFLKQVGVTSQREIERVVRESGATGQRELKVKVVLSAEGTDLHPVVEGRIDLVEAYRFDNSFGGELFNIKLNLGKS